MLRGLFRGRPSLRSRLEVLKRREVSVPLKSSMEARKLHQGQNLECQMHHWPPKHLGKSAKPRASLQGSSKTSSASINGRPSTTRQTSGDLRGTLTPLSSPSRPMAAQVPNSSSSASRQTANALSPETRKVSASSSSLRETIAKAKAARKSSGTKRVPSYPKSEAKGLEASFDFDLPSDPFNQNRDPDGNKGLLRKRVEAARIDGKLNIAAMGLSEIPEAVLKMYDLESADTTSGAWYESVDLVKFIAADNEIEELSEEVFPDVAPDDLLEEEDTKGNQFGGLEILDLHGNLLNTIPPGFRRLERLTKLNLVIVLIYATESSSY